jgi:hypothetical protein
VGRESTYDNMVAAVFFLDDNFGGCGLFLDAQLVELVSNSRVSSARLVILTSQNLGLARLVFLSSRAYCGSIKLTSFEFFCPALGSTQVSSVLPAQGTHDRVCRSHHVTCLLTLLLLKC